MARHAERETRTAAGGLLTSDQRRRDRKASGKQWETARRGLTADAEAAAKALGGGGTRRHEGRGSIADAEGRLARTGFGPLVARVQAQAAQGDHRHPGRGVSVPGRPRPRRPRGVHG